MDTQSNHDHEFTNTVANRVIEVTPRGVIDKMMCYDDYILDPEVRALRASMHR